MKRRLPGELTSDPRRAKEFVDAPLPIRQASPGPQLTQPQLQPRLQLSSNFGLTLATQYLAHKAAAMSLENLLPLGKAEPLADCVHC